MMSSGASQFAAGKTEEDYSIRSAAAVLNDLIDNYSGSYRFPVPTRMSDSDYDRAKQRFGGDGGSATPSPSADPAVTSAVTPSPDPASPSPSADPASPTPSAAPTPTPVPAVPQVGSEEDFMRLYHDAMVNTEEAIQFETVDGFTFDMAMLEPAYRELQREDPLHVGYISGWSWGYQGSSHIVELKYDYPVEEVQEMKEVTVERVDEAVAAIGGVGMSDYEIVLAVNDYLCAAAYYPESKPYAPVTHTAYGLLEQGVAVCEGYACATKLILNRFGILCDIEIGVCTNGEGHGWNLVMLEGQWYQLDVTWNDIISGHDYTLVTDEYMRQSRSWDYANYPVTATEPYTP